MMQIREEVAFTKGRIIVRGKLVTRGKPKRADCILYYKPNIPIAVIEAKDNNHSVGAGMQQALDYAVTLNIPFVFSSNGDGFVFHDRTGRIPDREAREWVQTHPKGQIAAGVSKNKATNGYFVQVVKLMKFWRDRLGTDPCNPKSYILEALIHGTIAAIVNVLEGLENSYGSYRNTHSLLTSSLLGRLSVPQITTSAWAISCLSMSLLS